MLWWLLVNPFALFMPVAVTPGLYLLPFFKYLAKSMLHSEVILKSMKGPDNIHELDLQAEVVH